MKTVNGNTGLYAILGNPIKHSMSTVIHNRSFERNGLDKVFLALKADLTDFDRVFPVLQGFGFEGFVFTMPNKEIAVKYMDELSPEAKIIGAINCAKNNDGKWYGYNTDSIGVWNSIDEANTSHMLVKHAFVLGCGGLSRAAIAQFALHGVKKITVANKLSDVSFVEDYKIFWERLHKELPDVKLELLDWKPEEWRPYLATADVVANGTPNGMKDVGDLHEIFPFDAVRKDTIFFDAIYIPRVTKFLKQASSLGHITVEGVNLLVHQGVVSFKIWTGIDVKPSVMKKDILDFWNGR